MPAFKRGQERGIGPYSKNVRFTRQDESAITRGPFKRGQRVEYPMCTSDMGQDPITAYDRETNEGDS
jgi:hypothetical protein